MRRSPFVQACWEPRFVEKSALFWPIARASSAFARHDRWPLVPELTAALGEASAVEFVVQRPRGRRSRRAPLDPGALYDAQIAEGRVPTRERNWHDLLNALVWAVFPRAKRALHARQHRAIAARLEPGAQRQPGARTREQDALAMLDEGGVVLLCEATVATALADLASKEPDGPAQDAALAAWSSRGLVTPIVFGHALYERLVLEGPRAIAATCVVASEGPLPADRDARLALVDANLAERLRAEWPARPEQLGHVTLAALSDGAERG